MAERVLTQAEVDTLLTGVKSGKVDTEAAGPPTSGIRTYDLINPDRLLRGRMPALEMINERFSKLFRGSILSILRKEAEFKPQTVETVKFGEFVKRFPVPASINLLKLEPLKGTVLFVMDAKTVYMMLDTFFGGTGQTQVKADSKEFTPIEQRFIKKILDLFSGDIEKAWQSVYPLKASFIRTESNPQYAMVIGPNETMLTMAFKLEIGSESHDMFLSIPYSAIEPIFNKLYSGFRSDHPEVDKNWTERFRGQLGNCFASAVVELGTATLTVQEVINFREGDILLLDGGPSDEQVMSVEGRQKFQGRVGMHRGKPAFQVTTLIRNQGGAEHGE